MKCPHCNTDIEPGYDSCWKCGRNVYDGSTVDQQTADEDALPCLRCGTALENRGRFDFHEGTQLGFFGNLFELFENKVSFDIYVCPACGKAEFYVHYKEKNNKAIKR